MKRYDFKTSVALLTRKTSLEMGKQLRMEFIKKGFKIDSVEYICIGYIHTKQATTQTALTEITGFNKVKIKRVVDKLILKDIVWCETNDNDKRILNLHITSYGKQLFAKLKKIASKMSANLLVDVKDEELEVVNNVLLKIIKNCNI